MSTVLVVVVLEAECFLLEYLRFWLRQPNLEFFTVFKINMASTAEGVIAAPS